MRCARKICEPRKSASQRRSVLRLYASVRAIWDKSFAGIGLCGLPRYAIRLQKLPGVVGGAVGADLTGAAVDVGDAACGLVGAGDGIVGYGLPCVTGIGERVFGD